MTKELIKKAFDAAEKEHQEKEIQKIKKIVQIMLEKIQSKSEQKEKLDEEIRLLKKDLDDLKAGRLDKIKERQDVDEKARDISIIIIKEIKEEYIPYRPWYSPWTVTLKYPSWYTNGNTQTSTGTGNMYYCNSSDCSLTATGNTISNFVGGSYNINGKIINL